MGLRIRRQNAAGDNLRFQISIGKCQPAFRPIGGIHIEGHLGSRRQIFQNNGAPGSVGVVSAAKVLSIRRSSVQSSFTRGSIAVSSIPIINAVIVPHIQDQGTDGYLPALENVFLRIGSAYRKIFPMAIPEGIVHITGSLLRLSAAHIPDFHTRRYLTGLRDKGNLLQIRAALEIHGHVLQTVAVMDIRIFCVSGTGRFQNLSIRHNHRIIVGVGGEHQFTLSGYRHPDPGPGTYLSVLICRPGLAFALRGVNEQMIIVISFSLQAAGKCLFASVKQPFRHASVRSRHLFRVVDRNRADIILAACKGNRQPLVFLRRIIFQNCESGPAGSGRSFIRLPRDFQNCALIYSKGHVCLHSAF